MKKLLLVAILIALLNSAFAQCPDSASVKNDSIEFYFSSALD